MGTEASSLTPEDSAGGGVDIAVGGAKGEGVDVGCGERVKVGVGEGGTDVADGCGVGEGVAVGCGDGVRVGVGGNVGLGDGCTAVGVEDGSLVAQPATRPIPIVAASTIRVRHMLKPVHEDCLVLFIMELIP